ncbi:hypothetical protein ABKN59_010301 [Abortiporus biennis]
MATNIGTFDLNLLTAKTRSAFEDICTPNEQRELILDRKALIGKVKVATPEQLTQVLGWTKGPKTTQDQLGQFLRYSKPHTRIYEAEPYLCSCIAHAQKWNPNSKDAVPRLWLAISLHKSPTKENQEESLREFKKGFDAVEYDFRGPSIGPKTELWTKMCMARLLRSMGKDNEAKNVENRIISWIKTHQLGGIPPSQMKYALVDDADPDAFNPVLEDPDVKAYFDSVSSERDMTSSETSRIHVTEFNNESFPQFQLSIKIKPVLLAIHVRQSNSDTLCGLRDNGEALIPPPWLVIYTSVYKGPET